MGKPFNWLGDLSVKSGGSFSYDAGIAEDRCWSLDFTCDMFLGWNDCLAILKGLLV